MNGLTAMGGLGLSQKLQRILVGKSDKYPIQSLSLPWNRARKERKDYLQTQQWMCDMHNIILNKIWDGKLLRQRMPYPSVGSLDHACGTSYRSSTTAEGCTSSHGYAAMILFPSASMVLSWAALTIMSPWDTLLICLARIQVHRSFHHFFVCSSFSVSATFILSLATVFTSSSYEDIFPLVPDLMTINI